MLPLSNLCHLPIKSFSVKLGSSEGPKFTRRFHSADAEAAGRINGAQFVPIPSTEARKRPQPAVAASGFDPFK
jgi:hypothetical protein